MSTLTKRKALIILGYVNNIYCNLNTKTGKGEPDCGKHATAIVALKLLNEPQTISMKKAGFSLVMLLVVFIMSSFPSFAARHAQEPGQWELNEPKRLNTAVAEAVAEFKSLSKYDRKARIKEAKKAVKESKKANRGDVATNVVLLTILAILLPPLAVYLYEQEINGRFWLSVLLTLLFWIPGVIYAVLLVNGAI